MTKTDIHSEDIYLKFEIQGHKRVSLETLESLVAASIRSV